MQRLLGGHRGRVYHVVNNSYSSLSDAPCRSTTDLALAVSSRMPWLMKAEPDSRIVKGKDVKVNTSTCSESPR